MTEPEPPGPRKKLEFIPDEYEDVVFVVTGNRVAAAVVRAFAPVVRVLFWVRRHVRRLHRVSSMNSRDDG